MAESDAMRITRKRSTWPRRTGYAIAMLTGLGSIFGLWRWSHHDRMPIVAVTPEPIIDVLPEPGARWHHVRTADTNGVELDEGTISLHIQRRGTAGRIVIVVPDGEIEDFGTVLQVRVAETHTTRVTVDEGNVAIRIRGVAEFRLGPGGSWAPEQLPAANPLPSVAQSSSVDNHPTTVPNPTPASKRSHQRTTTSSPRIDNDPHDAEDLAYLQVVKLTGAAKTTEARSLAREYLLRFPNGFRRVEMLDVATGRSDGR